MHRATLVLLGLSGCLMPDLSDTLDPGPPTEPDVVVRSEGGVTSLVVDATDPEAWIGLDLDATAFVELDDPSWDLAFRRFAVDLADELEAVVIEAVAFEELAVVPTEGWVTDQPDADDDGNPEYVFAEWYDYDPDTHVLTPADRVYVVATSDGEAVKVGFDSYYDDAGTPARIELRFASLGEAP